MTEKHIAIITGENGQDIVTGLNIMAAVIVNVKAEPLIEEVYQKTTRDTPMSRKDFLNTVVAAINHVKEINNTIGLFDE